jgi:hypothetical protein
MAARTLPRSVGSVSFLGMARVRPRGWLRRDPRVTSVRDLVQLRHHPLQRRCGRRPPDWFISCDACSPSSSVRPGHVSSTHLDGGSNVPCPSSSCSDSGPWPLSANRTSLVSTHPPSTPGSPPCVQGIQPAPPHRHRGRAHNRRRLTIRAHAGRYTGHALSRARFPTVRVSGRWRSRAYAPQLRRSARTATNANGHPRTGQRPGQRGPSLGYAIGRR